MWFTLQEAATAIAADPKNEMVVVGTSTGMFSVLDSMKGDHLFSYQATQTEIDCMQFSPGDIWKDNSTKPIEDRNSNNSLQILMRLSMAFFDYF